MLDNISKPIMLVIFYCLLKEKEKDFAKRISRSLYASLSARSPSIELKNFNLKVLVYKPSFSCHTQKFLSCSTEFVLKL